MHNIRAVLEHGFRAAFCRFCVNELYFTKVNLKDLTINNFILKVGKMEEKTCYT